MYPLQVENVSKHYGDKTAVNSINFNVRQGEIFGLLGANGAGKTTTMRMVLGLIYPDEGRILWKGGDDTAMNFVRSWATFPRNADFIRRSKFPTRLFTWPNFAA